MAESIPRVKRVTLQEETRTTDTQGIRKRTPRDEHLPHTWRRTIPIAPVRWIQRTTRHVGYQVSQRKHQNEWSNRSGG